MHTVSDVFVARKAGRPVRAAYYERALPLIIDPCPDNRPITSGLQSLFP